MQKRKSETPPAELLDRAFDSGEEQRHEKSLRGRKRKLCRGKVPFKRGTANEDQWNANDQKGIPSRAAAPEQHPSEVASQACETTVAGNKNERRDCGRVHGQKEERMVAGDLAKYRFHRFR